MAQLTVSVVRILWLGLLLAVAASARTTTIGYTQNPPMFLSNDAGPPRGFVGEVVQEAAAREGLPIQWKLIQPNTPTDDVDIFPAGVETAERRTRYYITAPWWRSALLLISREPLDTRGNLNDKIITTTGDLLPALQGKLTGARVERAATHTGALLALCDGLAQGFITDRVILDRLLLNRPAQCTGLAFSLTPVPDATLDYHILARPASRDAADRLLRGIERIKRDGTVARIALRYPDVSAGSAAFLASLLEASHQNSTLRSALWIAATGIAVLGALVFWLSRQIKARRRSEAELLRVNKELAETNADLEQFNYAASHDLTEPLRNMTLYSELLMRRHGNHLNSTGQNYLRVIQDGAKRMDQLLDGLRRYALLSKNAESSVADSTVVLREVCANLRPLIDESRATITSADLPVVPIEPTWLLQILQNLMSNAIKYRGSDPPQIHISVDRAGGQFRFSVRDNGVGIKPEYQERVFAVFKRLHGSEVAGTGIGLAICRKIVERHGGRIWVESNQDGSGSTFRFTIPASAK